MKLNKTITTDLQGNVMDPFYVEQNFWFVQWWKRLKWYCTLVKELQYYMDSCEEGLKKKTTIIWRWINSEDEFHLPYVWCESEFIERRDRAWSTICLTLSSRFDK